MLSYEMSFSSRKKFNLHEKIQLEHGSFGLAFERLDYEWLSSDHQSRIRAHRSPLQGDGYPVCMVSFFFEIIFPTRTTIPLSLSKPPG